MVLNKFTTTQDLIKTLNLTVKSIDCNNYIRTVEKFWYKLQCGYTAESRNLTLILERGAEEIWFHGPTNTKLNYTFTDTEE